MWKIIGIIALIVIGFVAGTYIYAFFKLPAYIWTYKHDIVIDILMVLLVLGAALGAGLYLLIRQSVESHAEETAAKRARFVGASVINNESYDYWQLSRKFHKSKQADMRAAYLGMAIERAREGLQVASRLDEKTHEELICWIKNNLAYYLADRGHEEDKTGAQRLAEYSYDRAHKYDKNWHWIQTYAFTLFNFLNCTEDEKAEGKKLIKNLLTRSDIPEDKKEEWQITFRIAVAGAANSEKS